MGLRDIGESLPPGFRFYPSDEELVCHYLFKKISNEHLLMGTLVDIDLHTCEPWQLPEVTKLNASEWYFFSFRDRKYATGYRTNRATISGYWKATGKDRTVFDPKTRAIVGMRKTLVFYKNRAPNGIKTGWIMHEFRLENPHIPPKEDWVLCRVFHKGKGDNSNEYSSQNPLENYTTSPNLVTSPSATDQSLPCGYHHHHHDHDQNTTNFLQQNPNYLQLSREGGGGGGAANEVSVDEMIVNSKPEDQYGFLFDMGLDQEHSFGDAVPLEDMRFDEDDDNGLVFL